MAYAPLTIFSENDGFSVERANQLYVALSRLVDPPYKIYTKPTGEANLTTTSTTYALLDGTADKFNLTITTYGNPVEIGLFGSFTNSVSGAFVYFDIELDGALIGGSANILAGSTVPTATNVMSLAMRRLQAVSAGSHTFKVYWKVTSGTGTLYSIGNPQFYVREI